MKLQTYLLLAISFMLLNAASCENETVEETLPPATQEGKYTFGCLVNGEVWVNKGVHKFGLPNISISIGNSFVGILATRTIGDGLKVDQTISLHIFKPIKNGIYEIKSNDYASYSDYVNSCSYVTDSSNTTGYLEITKYDTINKIVAGTFSFQAKFRSSIESNPSCNCKSDSVINVTDGRFDIKYY